MNILDIDQLDRRIQEALDLISVLRNENDALKSDLDQVKKSLQKKESGKGKALDKDQVKVFREDLQRLQNERIRVKKKIRNIMRKIEGIHLEEGKAQKDLFGPE